MLSPDVTREAMPGGDMFRILARRAGLPPDRLHDLRHGAASLAHAAGADSKTLLGHSSILVTADTYTSLLPQIQRRCADATALLVLSAARRTRKKIKTKARENRPDRGPITAAPGAAKPRTGASTSTKRKPSVKPPVRKPSAPRQRRFGDGPISHPRDTHRPQGLSGVNGGAFDPPACPTTPPGAHFGHPSPATSRVWQVTD
jgi:hypothetical protein